MTSSEFDLPTFADLPLRPELHLPKRPKTTGYVRPPRDWFHEVPDHAATLG